LFCACAWVCSVRRILCCCRVSSFPSYLLLMDCGSLFPKALRCSLFFYHLLLGSTIGGFSLANQEPPNFPTFLKVFFLVPARCSSHLHAIPSRPLNPLQCFGASAHNTSLLHFVENWGSSACTLPADFPSIGFYFRFFIFTACDLRVTSFRLETWSPSPPRVSVFPKKWPRPGSFFPPSGWKL